MKPVNLPKSTWVFPERVLKVQSEAVDEYVRQKIEEEIDKQLEKELANDKSKYLPKRHPKG